MKDPNMPELFVGRSQQDEGEPDTFDGTIWAPPAAQDRLDAAGGGPEEDITLIASGIRHEEDAERLVRCWNCHDDLLAACEAALKEIESKRYVAGCVDDAPSAEWRRLLRLEQSIRAVLARAKEQP